VKTGRERAKTVHEQVTGPGPTRAKKKEPTCPFDSESVLKYLVDNGCPNIEKSKVRSIREKQRLSGASEAKTSISVQKPGKTAYHKDFLRSSKTPEGTIQKTAKTHGGPGCPSGILGGEGSVSRDLG